MGLSLPYMEKINKLKIIRRMSESKTEGNKPIFRLLFSCAHRMAEVLVRIFLPKE